MPTQLPKVDIVTRFNRVVTRVHQSSLVYTIASRVDEFFHGFYPDSYAPQMAGSVPFLHAPNRVDSEPLISPNLFFGDKSSHGFGSACKHRHISEDKLIVSFKKSAVEDIVEILKEVLSSSENRYVKLASILETKSMEDAAVEKKWKAVLERVNEEVFGIVDWKVILSELGEERAKEENLLNQLTKERRIIRKKLPTAVVKKDTGIRPITGQHLIPIELLKEALPAFEQQSEPDIEPSPLSPPEPESKHVLLEKVTGLIETQKQALEEIHERKLDLVNTHGKGILRKVEDEANNKTEEVEAFKRKIANILDKDTKDQFLTDMHSRTLADLDTRLDQIIRDRDSKIGTAKNLWNDSLQQIEERKNTMQAALENHIDRTQTTFGMIEDSGLLTISKDGFVPSFDINNQQQAASYLSDIDASLNSRSAMSKEQLAKTKKHVQMIWEIHSDIGMLSKTAKVVEKLIMLDNMPDESKGKLISLLINALKTDAKKEAATAIEEIIELEDFKFRLSLKDAEIIIDCMSAKSIPVRAVAIMVGAQQLYLERNEQIPRHPEEMSKRMLVALLAAMKDKDNRGVFSRLNTLQFVKLDVV